MPGESYTIPTIAVHGASHLPSVDVGSYNVELRDDEGFLGDRACKAAFRAIIENWRKPLRKSGRDPFGDQASDEISKKKLDDVLVSGDPEAAGILQGAIEDFAQELAIIIRRFLRLRAWRNTERIVIGGGFRATRVGELVIGRAAVILKSDGVDLEIVPIHRGPHEAGLTGAVHLSPSWIFEAYDAILAVDVGGTNIRTGVIRLNLRRFPDLAKAAVWKFELWRHGNERLDRKDAVDGLIRMLKRLIARAEKEGLQLAPFIGIGCPGKIESDGSIDRGAQNLPGNWHSSRFNLPAAVRKAIPKIAGHETAIVMHNDAVVQGLSEVPFMRDVKHWGILTIGTGLGNACFTNRRVER
jgi:predicted NBD/HSP70 family sugar kinase